VTDIKRDNDYAIIVFCEKDVLVKMSRVHSCVTAANWLSKSYKYRHWTHFNVYANRSGRFICQMVRNRQINPFPR
jgi:hypothetical protein